MKVKLRDKVIAWIVTLTLAIGLCPGLAFADLTGGVSNDLLGATSNATVDDVLAAIGELSNDPRDFTAADKERVVAIQADYEALSAEDQATIDATFNHPSGDGQSYGRILEAAVWAVMSYDTDTSTTLANGTYTTSTDPAVSSQSDKGKSDSSRVRNWWVESVEVQDGQATAKIYVTSGAATASKLTSYPSVWIGGQTVNLAEDSTFTIPIDLNGVTYFGGISSSMPRPIMYTLTTEIDESTAPQPIELAITNNTSMFKAETASAVENEGGSAMLTMALSGTGYRYLCMGTYEQAVANGDATENWIAGHENAMGKWEFQIPIAADELGTDVPVVAISQSYYEKYLSGQNSIARAFYPRQLNLDLEAKTLVTGDYEASKAIAVTNNVSMFSPASEAALNCVGGPNSNNYKADLVLPMTTASMSDVFVGTPAEAAEATETIAFDTSTATDAQSGTFTIPVKWVETFGQPETTVNLANGEPFVISFKSARNDSWYGRQATLDEEAGTLVFDSWIDPAPANTVDELIAKIQSQVFTDTTYADCEAAKAAWDALSDAEKALVEEYDYFGLDTGDASADDPLNQDEIGENEILVVSFGTSFNDSRVATIGGVEKALQAAYPEWQVRRAFTAQIIINHVYARDGEKIDNVDQALERAVANGVKNLVVQPTHLMHGAEYDELVAALAPYQDKMSITVAEPLLGEVGADATAVNDDKKAVAEAVVAEAAAPSDTALVLMGHGTSHAAAVTYQQMQAQMDQLGYENVFIGTVEGEPEGTDAASVIAKVKAAGFSKVILRPLMVVAGDHANNDMADPDDEESWYSQFTAEGNFAPENVTCQIAGLGQIPAVQQIYVAHTAAAISAEPVEPVVLEDGTYKLPGLAAGPSSMFNHLIAAESFLKVEGDSATIIFTEDGSTASVGKYSRLALGKSSELLPAEGNYFADSVLPEGTVIIEGTDAGTGTSGTKWHFEVPITKTEAEALLSDPNGKLYVTVWNNVGSSAEKIPGWYKASDDIYLSLGELGEKIDVPVPIELAITNNTNMFKVVTASVVGNEDGTAILTVALSGAGYHYLYKGTYEDAVANGDATENWIAGYENAEGKWEFQIPIAESESYIPVVAISNSYYQKYLEGQNPIERAFYPRQMALDLTARTLLTDDFNISKELEVTNNYKMFKVASATFDTVGGPNSNGYAKTLNITMSSNSYTKAYLGTLSEAEAAADSEVIALEEGNTFAFKMLWMGTAGDPSSTVKKWIDGEPFFVSFWSEKNSAWYERILTLDEAAGTLVTNNSEADYTAVNAAKEAAEALERDSYTAESLAAVDEAVGAVVNGKPASQQSEVDAMAEAIEAAIAALKFIPVEKIPYDGDAYKIVKSDLESKFGMLNPSPADSLRITYDDGKLTIKYTPSNKTVYAGIYMNADIRIPETWDDGNYITIIKNADIEFTLDESYAGYAWPIAPNKRSDASATTAAQYYMAIPAIDKIAADYSAVDAAKAKVPADLTIYTDETAQAVTAAVAAVVEGKDIREQSQVDAMAQAIENAIAALVLTPAGEQAIADDIAAAEKAANDLAAAEKAAKDAADKAAKSKAAAEQAAKTPGEAAVKAAEQATKDAEAAATAAAAYQTAAEAAKTAAAKALASAQVPGSNVSADKVAELETAASTAEKATADAADKVTKAQAAVTSAKTAQAAAVKAKEAAEKATPKTKAKADQKITAKAKNTKSFKASAKTGKLAKNKVIKLKKLAKVSAKTTVTYKKANKAGGKKIVVNKKTGKVTVKKGLKKGKYTVKIKLTAGANDSFNAAKAKTIRLIIRIK